jgi:hypothetical protein
VPGCTCTDLASARAAARTVGAGMTCRRPKASITRAHPRLPRGRSRTGPRACRRARPHGHKDQPPLAAAQCRWPSSPRTSRFADEATTTDPHPSPQGRGAPRRDRRRSSAARRHGLPGGPPPHPVSLVARCRLGQCKQPAELSEGHAQAEQTSGHLALERVESRHGHRPAALDRSQSFLDVSALRGVLRCATRRRSCLPGGGLRRTALARGRDCLARTAGVWVATGWRRRPSLGARG